MTKPLNVLLVPVGSHGDVHPFIGIGTALRNRGHRVTVIVAAYFEPLVRRAGLDVVPLGTAQEYETLAADPELWHPTRGVKKVFAAAGEGIRPVYEAVVERNVPGETVVVASSLALGARVARETHGIPTATVHLQPAVLRTVYAVPKLPGMRAVAWLPKWAMRRLFDAVDRYVIDPAIAPKLNAFRAEKGLRPASSIISNWWNSPDLVLGLFPEWFAPPQPDWPPQLRLTGFPMYDERGLEPLPENLQRFLSERPGDKPIAFTPGSAMWHGRVFFEAAAGACARLGRRGLLLTRHRGHLPASLPPGVIHVDYAPFSELLPRCAALVHHGGIGTTAQAMAAGMPQLVMPLSHDQPDNADRLERLGIGAALPPRRFTAQNVARKLAGPLESPDVAARCREVAGRFVGAKPLGETCELIEKLAGLPVHRPVAPGRA